MHAMLRPPRPAAAPPAEEGEEADFPDVQLDELLEDFDEMTLGDGEGEEVQQ